MTLLKKVLTLVSMLLFLGCAVALEESEPGAGGKVAVCHKGKKTIYVDEAAVNAHLGHGDYMGTCK